MGRRYILARQSHQHGAGLGPERHDPAANLGIRELDAFVLDLFPEQVLDFRQPEAGQQQQAQGDDYRGHLNFNLAYDLAQALGLLRQHEPLSLVLILLPSTWHVKHLLTGERVTAARLLEVVQVLGLSLAAVDSVSAMRPPQG